jgi:hypothetical protein
MNEKNINSKLSNRPIGIGEHAIDLIDTREPVIDGTER